MLLCYRACWTVVDWQVCKFGLALLLLKHLSAFVYIVLKCGRLTVLYVNKRYQTKKLPCCD